MAEPVDLKGAFDLPPEDAMRYFDGKGLKTSVNWTDVWEAGHARNFTVAKIAQTDLLTTVRKSLSEALATGQTFESWKANIVPELERAGWWGKVQNQDLTGTGDAIYVGPRRLKVIYDTNLRTARAAGQWARIQQAKGERPYLRYSAVLDRRTRPQHRAWHGTVLPVDHPWWQSHFPPNGWFCFLPGTRVEGRPIAGVRLWHDGKAVEVTTRAGRNLSVTADHPVLTRRGWISAKHLVIGDDLLGHGRQFDALSGPVVDNEQAPSRVEDLFQSLAAHSLAVGQSAPNDFNDGLRAQQGNAAAVAINRELAAGRNALSPQLGDERSFDGSLGSEAAHAGEGAPLHRAWRQDALGSGDLVDPRLAVAEPASDRRSGELALGGERDDARLEVGIAATRGGPGSAALLLDPLWSFLQGLPLAAFRLGSAAQDDALFNELATKALAADAGLFRQLLQAGTGRIAMDEVVEVRHFDFCGHVYDFQTHSGLISAEGVIVHNCRCNVQQLSERDLKRFGYKVTAVPPAGPPTTYVSRTGFTAEVPAGIDPGFGHNTGRAGMQAIVERAGESLQKASEAGLTAEARAMLQQMLDSPAIEQVLVDNQPGMPVAVLSDELLTLTGGTNRVATLSEWSLEHIQSDRARSYPAAVYRAIQAGLEDPRLRILQDDGRILSVIDVGGQLYAVLLNPVTAKNELWLHTLFDVDAKDLATLRRRGTILIDNL